MSDVWEGIWDLLGDTFRRVAVALQSRYPKMTWSSGQSDNRSFPFRAYATFNRGSGDSEDVIVSVDFHRSSDGELRYSSDVGLDDGTVLADGPVGVIDVSQGVEATGAEIRAAIDCVIQFLEASEQVVGDAMS